MKNIIKILIVVIIGVATNEDGFSTVPLTTICQTADQTKTVKMENEIWKDITGFEGYYQIGNLGSIKSIDRIIPTRRGVGKFIAGKILKPHLGTNGYLYVNLSKNGIHYTKTIHSILSNEFIPNPENKPEVNHKDGIKHHSYESNLEWCTHSENGLHAYRMGLSTSPNKGKFGSLNHRSKRIIQLNLNGTKIESFGSVREANRVTKISNGHISECANGIRMSAGGFIWKYAS